MEKIKVTSTSRRSAECSDMVLRETGITRLIFRPQIVDNPSNPRAAVNGIFVFQRKGPGDEWADTKTIQLSKLKKGEGYKLELKSGEVLKLYFGLEDLYKLHAKEGVPRGSTEFIRVSQQLAQIAELNPGELDRFFEADQTLGSNLLAKLLQWATDVEDPSALVERLVELGPASLRKLNMAVNLQNLKNAIAIWRENEGNSDEEFWQRTLTENSFVLEHVFSWPLTIFKQKAYVGGKTVMNEGGSIVDFLVENQITKNAALIEIKTPTTSLYGQRPYRTGIYNPSEDLMGAVMQILNYKHTLQRKYDSLIGNLSDPPESFDPRCAVIVGNAKQELRNRDKKKSFELFRAQLLDVDVITFDELFSKTQKLVAVLESGGAQGCEPGNDIPF